MIAVRPGPILFSPQNKIWERLSSVVVVRFSAAKIRTCGFSEYFLPQGFFALFSR